MTTTFSYKVRDDQGQLLEGEMEAESKAGVANELRQRGWLPVAIESSSTSLFSRELKIPGLSDRVKQKDVAIMARQFATMVDSGLSLVRALAILADQTENPVLAGVIGDVRRDVEQGTALSLALSRHPKAFNRLFVAMVRAGESGGVLDDVLLQVATIIEKQVDLKRKITSALTYPIAVLGLVVVIVVAMLIFVVPTFKSLYDGFQGTLPLPTRGLLAFSALCTKFFPVVLLATGGGIFGFRRWLRTDRGRARFDRWLLRVPIAGKLVHKTALTRFARTLAVLTRSGVPILECLEITGQTVGNAVVAAAVADVQEGVLRGEPMSEPLGHHAVFPSMVTQMLAVGEETGNVEGMLDKVADFYDQEVEATVNALTSLLEPVLIVVLGGIVGAMVVSLYLPMFQLVNQIK